VQFFSLVRVRKLVCELYKGKKTLYTAFILISHFILRFDETSVQFGGTLQISLVLGYIRDIRKVRNTQEHNPNVTQIL
jgi:hypothetical protein